MLEYKEEAKQKQIPHQMSSLRCAGRAKSITKLRRRWRVRASAGVGSRVGTVLHCLQTLFCSQWD